MNFKTLLFCLSLSLLTGCKSKLDKLLMSNDLELKEQKAKEYFENCNYTNASPLFKDLIQSFSSSAKVEKMYFYYAYCDYGLEDYLMGAYEFQKLLDKFPRGAYAERAQFLLAMCYYKSTPKFNLDQEYNLTAIEQFQIFLEKYPESEQRKEANEKIDELFTRLEKKSYESANLYYQKEDYKSSLYTFEQILGEFPDTKNHEEIRYLLVSSAFLYAEQSIEAKKTERYQKVNEYASDYFKRYTGKTDLKYFDKVKEYQEKANQSITKLTYSLPEYYYKKKNYDEAFKLWSELIKKEKDLVLKNQIASSLLFCKYNKALESNNANRLQYINDFLDNYRVQIGNVSEDQKNFWTLKYKYFFDLSKSLPYKIPYLLVEETEYKQACESFKTLLDTSTLADVEKSKHFYAFLNAKFKYAKNSNEEIALKEYNEIIKETQEKQYWKNTEASKKIENLIIQTNYELSFFPVALVSKPMERKDYRLAIQRAQELIKNKKLEKNQEEVVYLMLFSALKSSKKGKKFVKLPKYEYANRLFNEYQSLVTDPKKQKKLDKAKTKINRKISKYQNK